MSLSLSLSLFLSSSPTRTDPEKRNDYATLSGYKGNVMYVQQ
jgi:hypothetical protein